MLYLRTFGGLTLENGGHPPIGAGTQRSRLALLAVLAAAGELGIGRDTLLSLFWPESDTELARGALKQAMYALRRDLGEPDLLVGSDTLSLNPSVLRSDVAEFTHALAHDELERGVALYRGKFLEGVHINGGEFDRWLDRKREQYVRMHQEALGRLARDAEQRSDYARAVRWWRVISEAEPTSATVACSLMLALARAGDPAAALRHSRVHEQLVRSELDSPPDKQIRDLVARIGRGEIAAIVPDRGLSSAVASGASPHLATEEHSAPPARPRWVVPAICASALGILVIGTAVVSRAGRLDPDRVAIVVRAGGQSDPAVDNLINAELTSGLTSRIRALRISPELGGARYLVEIVTATVNDSLRIAAGVTDLLSDTGLGPAGAVTSSIRDARAGVRVVVERIAVVLSARRDPLFANWAHAAELPYSWAAFEQIGLGIKAFVRGETAKAQSNFRAATTLDSTSATALVWDAYVAGGDAVGSDSTLARGERSTRRHGAWERELGSFLRARNRRDLPGQHAAGHRLLEAVPGSDWALLLAGAVVALGRYQEAVELSEPVLRNPGWSRDWPFASIPAEQGYHALGDFRRELEIVRRMLHRLPDSRLLLQQEVKGLAGLGRVAELNRICDRAIQLRPEPQFVEWQPCDQALIELAAHRQPEAARALVERLLPVRFQMIPSARARVMARADLYAALPDWEKVAEVIREVPEDETGRQDDLEYAALVQASRGDRTGVQRTLERLDSLFVRGVDSLRRDPYLLAGVASLLGDHARAVDNLQAALRAGWSRIPLHWAGPFDRLRGYPPFEELLRPAEDREHLALVSHVVRP